ncbi:MGMT family protein [Aspergillus steynii IBT 23096]|uniref:MGMT family protein n=1 Tax=Aspergillus steynii IBT 23096 TaxID=1392250 RepID=A0A2I2FW83_9EURO|nr:MGMT family protein [Aspergillus steynii IBT 23096]PLB44888.1 MGMT family protein [Aspergillus steynii IBT 23096]
MPRSEEAEFWINAVYAAVQEVPVGKVTTYGQIALLLGQPQRPRQVGVSLKHLPSDPTQYYNSSNVPWQRVINSKGMISHREPGSAERQAEVLRGEGVEVLMDSMGEFYINLDRYGWFPAQLPSEELDDESE